MSEELQHAQENVKRIAEELRQARERVGEIMIAESEWRAGDFWTNNAGERFEITRVFASHSSFGSHCYVRFQSRRFTKTGKIAVRGNTDQKPMHRDTAVERKTA